MAIFTNVDQHLGTLRALLGGGGVCSVGGAGDDDHRDAGGVSGVGVGDDDHRDAGGVSGVGVGDGGRDGADGRDAADASRAVAEVLAGLSDDDLLTAVSAASGVTRAMQCISVAATGEVAARSERAAGHDGLAAKRGHRTPASLLQELTGVGRADAGRQVRVGVAVREGLGIGAAWRHAGDGAGGGDAVGGAAPVGGDVGDAAETGLADHGTGLADVGMGSAVGAGVPPWHSRLSQAHAGGAITAEQFAAIFGGLGDPPVRDGDGPTDAAAWRDVWSAAAEQLMLEARERTVDELRSAARCIRDQLDPDGAEQRFLQRYEARAFRMWTDEDGIYRGSFRFDDEAALWLRSVIDAALRPRKGGPRFVDSAERQRAQQLVDDPRTNDQLTYDLLFDVMRAGTHAEAKDVLGVRQPAVRVVQVADSARVSPGDGGSRGLRGPGRPGEPSGPGRPGGPGGPGGHAGRATTNAPAFTEDGLHPLPRWLAAQRICESGTRTVSTDDNGNPLFLGREQRTFTSAQRIALAVRDGGCRWPGCDRPASYCEAHHIDSWAKGGRTDIDRGILLCRFHHMNLHARGASITRTGTASAPGDFVLHTADGRHRVLRARAVLTIARTGVPGAEVVSVGKPGSGVLATGTPSRTTLGGVAPGRGAGGREVLAFHAGAFAPEISAPSSASPNRPPPERRGT